MNAGRNAEDDERGPKGRRTMNAGRKADEEVRRALRVADGRLPDLCAPGPGMPLDATIEPRRLGPPLTEISADLQTDPLRLARPLLRVTRPATLAYCAEFGLPVIEDLSNLSRSYTRNRVRLDLLPALEQFNPGIRGVLARTADLAAEDADALESIVAELHTSLARTPQAGIVEYDLRLWRTQPRALQRRLLRHGLESLLGGLVDVRASPIEDALDVVQSGTPAQTYHLPNGVELCIGLSTLLLL